MVLLVPVFSKIHNLIKELTKVLPNIKFHEVKDPEKDQFFKNSGILITDFDLLSPYIYQLPNTKWVQGTWAGVDVLTSHIQKSKSIPYKITRFTGEHFGKLMSEYILANIVNFERDLFRVKANQLNKQWIREGKIEDYRTISDLTVGILGVGNIGNTVGKVLCRLGAKVLAFGRRSYLPLGSEGEYSHIMEYYTKDTLPALLQECDYIINLLPHTEETTGLLDDILKNCAEKCSIFINVGRGNIISEDALIKALQNKWLSAAILDVFDVEPLPPTSKLWETKNVFITPHVSAMSRARDIAELFCSNLELYRNNLPLPAVVDFNRGY